MSNFKEFIFNYNREIIEERESSFDGQIVNAIAELIEKQKEIMTTSDVCVIMIENGSDPKYANTRSVGKHLRQLGIETHLMKINGKAVRQLKFSSKFLNLAKRYVSDRESLGNMVSFVTTVSYTPSKKQEKDENPQKTLPTACYDNSNEKTDVLHMSVTNVTTLPFLEAISLNYDTPISISEHIGCNIDTAIYMLEYLCQKGEIYENPSGHFKKI
jgi:hypothetical protein